MPFATLILCLSILSSPTILTWSAQVAANSGEIRLAQISLPSKPKPSTQKRVVIAASTVLNGKGRVLRNTRIESDGTKIVAIDRRAGPVDYDLRGLTVLPGWIDAHVHITWTFGKDGTARRLGRQHRHRMPRMNQPQMPGSH